MQSSKLKVLDRNSKGLLSKTCKCQLDFEAIQFTFMQAKNTIECKIRMN